MSFLNTAPLNLRQYRYNLLTRSQTSPDFIGEVVVQLINQHLQITNTSNDPIRILDIGCGSESKQPSL